MLIQVNTDHNVNGNTAMIQAMEATIQDGLARFSDRITRVELHVSDENGEKKGGGEDKRCLLEARVIGRQPISVSHRAATVIQAVAGAVEQMERSLDSTLGKLSHH